MGSGGSGRWVTDCMAWPWGFGTIVASVWRVRGELMDATGDWTMGGFEDVGMRGAVESSLLGQKVGAASAETGNA